MAGQIEKGYITHAQLHKAGLKGEISNELTAVGGFEPSIDHLYELINRTC